MTQSIPHDRIICSLPSSQLRQSDYESLDENSQEWLNDQTVSFAFEYLTKLKPRTQLTDGTPTEEIAYIDPCVIIIVSLMDDVLDIATQIDNLNLRSKSVILVPMIDKYDPSKADSGAHWFLLLGLRVKSSSGSVNFLWYLYDTIYTDSPVGETFTRRCASLIQKLYSTDLLGDVTSDDLCFVSNLNCPDQGNSYDCGRYVIAFADAIVALVRMRKVPTVEGSHDKDAVEEWLRPTVAITRSHIARVCRDIQNFADAHVDV